MESTSEQSEHKSDNISREDIPLNDGEKNSVEVTSEDEIADFKPFSVRKFLLIFGGILFSIFAVLFLIGFIAALNGTRPASFDNEIIQRQLDSLMHGEDAMSEIPNELEKNE